jgi:hypothetical protein
MSLEEPSTTLPAGQFEPLQPPEPVPAPARALPEEPEGAAQTRLAEAAGSGTSPLPSPTAADATPADALDVDAAGSASVAVDPNAVAPNPSAQLVAPEVQQRADRGPVDPRCHGTLNHPTADHPTADHPTADGQQHGGPDTSHADSSGGRHARRGALPAQPAGLVPLPWLDYTPRHAANPSGEFVVSPTDVTEILSRIREDPTEAPQKDRPESDRRDQPRIEQPQPAPPAAEPEPESLPPGKRVKVVLSQRKGQARPVRTVVDVQELTQVGEMLSSSLIRSQLALSVRIAAIMLVGLGALPAMFFFVPRLAALQLFGLRLPWLLLGGAVYPFLLFLGWMYSRSAEKLEKIFADHIRA